MAREATNDLEGTDAGPLSTTAPLAGGRPASVEDIAGRLLCAEEELAAAHRQCIDADEKFAHEIAQMQFAIGAIRLSWRKRHGI